MDRHPSATHAQLTGLNFHFCYNPLPGTFEKPKSLKWYRNECNVLLNYAPLAGARLDEINDEMLAGFESARLKQGRKISTVNSTIRVLRSALAHAADDGLPAFRPKLKILPGAKHREHVVRPNEEAKYLAVAPGH